MLTFFSTELHIGWCTQTRPAQFHHIYSESLSSFVLPFSGRAGTSLGEALPCLWTTYCFNFSQSCSLCSCPPPPPVRGIAHRPSVVRSTFCCLVNRTLRHGTSTHLHPLSNPRASFCAPKGFCGASGEETARGVKLYEGMVAAC